ncbi:hypothetical protein P9E05_02000 [Bacillus mojavensis]|uniref:hypothetical protein n=1 Tax=Bacillus mojavensis TaxID=72360 RepID=UPI002DB9AE71|nr:hypothetical protein [Bacillus mojavensis]MEC1690298.1 hypothetical protein [Bacillus mojavensis]
MKREYAFKPNLDAMGYEELLAHGDAVMEAIKERTFQEGFRAAKQVQRKLAEMKTSINDQARRDEIVEQAKADVKELANKYGYYYAYGRNTKAEFIVNCEKRTVVTILRWVADGQIVAKGIAKAAPSDCFNVHIGKAIALRRALGLAVPAEYLNAPQPTEVRVGDVIMPSVMKKNTPRIVVATDAEVNAKANTCCPDSIMATNKARIIDDSREEVCE